MRARLNFAGRSLYLEPGRAMDDAIRREALAGSCSRCHTASFSSRLSRMIASAVSSRMVPRFSAQRISSSSAPPPRG